MNKRAPVNRGSLIGKTWYTIVFLMLPSYVRKTFSLAYYIYYTFAALS
jgi:hypothetical protein